ncbi:hypothetical protein EC973_001008 [Apophysomyces ossiformis]|uniref:TM7S3/TM198-like domain-containing protein n=1 Tax=Apophysomyces ossiformis TaxID=679940 RepID=A0A8H7BRS7_9FUNG|nr:hypothetical protein EC973_001008 [Apophysomyces ossiformis]
MPVIISWVLLTAAEPRTCYPSSSVVYVCTCFAVGLLVAGIATVCWRCTMHLLGSLAGFVLCIYIYCWREDYILLNVYARMFTSLGFAVAGYALMRICEHVTAIFSTSFLGAYVFIFGLDLLVNTGMVNGPRSLLDANPHFIPIPYELTHKVYAMLGAVLAMWLVAMIFQKVYNHGHRFGFELVKA